MDLEGQTALVTGGARGIGLAIAEALASRGANVALADIDAGQAAEAADKVAEAGVKTMSARMDASNSADVKRVIAEVKEEFGRLDIMINNAGITRDGLLMRMKDEDWDAVMSVNLKSVFLCTREAVKVMVKQRSGRIINIASVVAFTGNPGQANYSASKAGIVGLTKTTAREYAARNITANAVAPGFIMTAMTEKLPEGVKEEMKSAIPLGSFGTAEDVAQAVVFLASPGASYITGQVIHVNGGMYM